MASTAKNEELLKEIRENFDYAKSYWGEIYKEGAIDVRYAIKGPWDEEELELRKGRPTLVLDELNQYLNQQENAARQSKRSVKVNPEGDGANDQTALVRAGIIRGIEYKCRAQQAYITAYGCALRRSYGYFKLTTDFEPGSFNRVLKVVRIPNPDVIYLDPEAKEADWSDGQWSFEVESMRERAYLKRWPKAEIRSFSSDHVAAAPAWIGTEGKDGRRIQVASYCRLENNKVKLLFLENGKTINMADAEEDGVQLTKTQDSDGKVEEAVLVDGNVIKVEESREDNDPHAVQYVSNGVEVLERNPLDFTEIPIIPVFGPEEWVPEGLGSRRIFLSMVRGARDAYKGLCYAKSAIVERLGMDPKSPYEGYQGQFDTATDFRNLGANPVGYVEFKQVENAFAPGQPLPLPQRNLVEPQIGQYETAGESFRRSVQSAMGGSPLPTSAQRQNEKSGIALKTIEDSSSTGLFHYLDNFGIALERAGRMMDAVLDVVYDTPGRQVPFNDEAGEHKLILINQVDEGGNKVGFHTSSGDHGVTITTGPTSNDQRDEATDFINNLIAHPQILGPNAQKILALLVKLRNLGPIGDRVADILDPTLDGGLPPQIQAAQQQIQVLTQEIQALKAGDAIKKYVADLQAETARRDTDEQEKTKRVLGLIKIDQQDAEKRLDAMLNTLSERFDRLHDAQQQLAQHQHEQTMQRADQAHAADLQAAEQDHAATMAQMPPQQPAAPEGTA